MTTSRTLLTLVLVAFLGGAGAMAQSKPEGLTWAIGEFSGPADWSGRLPLLFTAALGDLEAHRLSEVEAQVRRSRTLDKERSALEAQASRLQLELDRKRLAGPLPTTEPAATQKTLADLKAKLDQRGAAFQDLRTLPLSPVWAPGRPGLPWAQDGAPLVAARSGATYVITGEVRPVGPAFGVRVAVYSEWEGRSLAQWQGFFQPDEAGEAMALAADALRATLLGRDWARLAIRGPSAVRVRVGDTWSPLPWTSTLLEPGDHEVVVRRPSQPDEVRVVTLESLQSTVLDLEAAPVVADLVLETNPPGALLYLDSRYLGPSPQVVERPQSITRVRVETLDAGTQAWEIGPHTASPFVMNLGPPAVKPDVPRAKDEFYWSLAAFSVSLTSTAFAGAWNGEQAQLANAYAAAGNLRGYDAALDKYYLTGTVYVSGFVLTSGLFVWMMFELGEYLAAAQASLP